MPTWYPGALTYAEWSQAESFFSDFRDIIVKNSTRISNLIKEQTDSISSQTKTIVATNEQIIQSLEDGFNRLASISQKGFQNVTSAIEAMHSDMNYNLGILIQRIEHQNDLLLNILSLIQAPFEVRVREFYSKGCMLINQGNLNKAISYFETSIELETGDIFFPSFMSWENSI